MKKRISLLVCAIALALSFTGCSGKESVKYDKDTLETACEQVFAIVENGSITEEQVDSMSDWNQGYLMAQFESQTGVKMDADAFTTALAAWQASLEECGAYIDHGDFSFKESSTGVVASTEAEFADRSASLEFSFDEKLKLESFSINAHYGPSEILGKAGMNTLIGMGTVFVVLIFMSIIIYLMKYIPVLFDKSGRQKNAEVAQVDAGPAVSAEVVEESVDDIELVAVIAAAIAAYEGTSTDGFVVRSVKRRKSNKWNA